MPKGTDHARGPGIRRQGRSRPDLPRRGPGQGRGQQRGLPHHLPKVLSGHLEPGARATVRLKDLTYIAQSMEFLGISLPVVDLVRDLHQNLIDVVYGDENHSAIVRVFEMRAGVEARG
ncbi:MAG: NAD-binding protein [SAR324 cluster bacterium]|nr:NAD-binding protein [SAR324 cluster bacterium]